MLSRHITKRIAALLLFSFLSLLPWIARGQEEILGAIPSVELSPNGAGVEQALPSTEGIASRDMQWREVASPQVFNDRWWNREIINRLLILPANEGLTLAEAHVTTLEMSPELLSVRASLGAAGYEVVRRDAAFDWTTFADSTWKDDSAPIGSALDGAQQRLRSDSLTMRGGVRRATELGGRVQVSQDGILRDSNSQFFSPTNQGSSRLIAELKQPLMRGRGREVTTAGRRLAEIESRLIENDLRTATQDQLLKVSAAYWDLVRVRGQLVISSRSWRRAYDVAQMIEARQDIDATGRLRLRAASEVSSRQSRAQATEYDVVRAQEALLRAMLGRNYGMNSPVEFVPVTTAESYIGPVPMLESTVSEGLINRPEIARAREQLEAAALERSVAMRDLKPVLDLVMSSYVTGLRGNYDVAGSFADQFSTGEPGYAVGVVGELPYRNRAAKATLSQKNLILSRFQAEFEMVVADVELDIRDAAIAEVQALVALHAQTAALDNAIRELDYVQTRQTFLADGNRVADLYLNDLLQTQARLETAELEMLRTEVEVAARHFRRLHAMGTIMNVAAESQPVEETAGDVDQR